MKTKLKFRAIVGVVVIAALLLSACGNSGSSGDTSNVQVPEALAARGDIKINVIRKIGGDDHTAQFLAGAQQEGEALGFNVTTFSAGGDTAKFLDALEQAANGDYDGVIVSHADDAASVEAVRKLRDKGIEVVAFDSIDGLKEIDGVTLTAQDDAALAQFALDKLIEEHGTDANIVYLWVDGFPPMVRRNAVYEQVLAANPGIVELERYGVANDNPSVDTQNAVAAMLAKYPKGEIDAIFATWDAFASGAMRALVEAGRTEIKIYGIDVSNADLQMMQQEDSPWVATAAVDPKMIGAVNVRLLAKKLAGEETPDTFDLKANLIDQETLAGAAETVNMATLADVIPDWGQSDAFEEGWMRDLKAATGK